METQDYLAELYTEAEKAIARNEPWEAIGVCTAILTQTLPQEGSSETQRLRLKSLILRADALRILGEQAAALAGYEQYYRESGSTQDTVEALVYIGMQASYMGQHQRALEVLRQALPLAESLNYTLGRARALGGLGTTLYRLGRAEEAISHLKRALALFEQVNEPKELGRGWNRMGVVHINNGEIDKAIAAFRASLPRARAAHDQETVVYALNNLGECHQMMFNMEQALNHHREALATAQEMQAYGLEADVSRNLGIELWQSGQIEEGIAYLQRSLKISQETDRPDIMAQALYSLVLAEIEQGHPDDAYIHIAELQSLTSSQQTRSHEAFALHALGLYYQGQNDLAAAQRVWQQALFLAHETGQRILLWKLHAILAATADRPALAKVHYRIASEVIQSIAEPIEDAALRKRFLQAAPVAAVLAAAAN